ncbi:hypothetical protein ABE545_10595 [Sphingobacterium faecium]|uniref:hypothetical protein n=1 Tax=Sphingobacterium faecium TaxID=34087 RepID=UPI003207C33F
MKQPISKLKEFFGAFKMPTANNFGDLVDSFFHKDGKIPAANIEGWTDDSAVILEPGVLELPVLGDKNKNVTVFGGTNGRTYTFNGIPYFIAANHQAILFWAAVDQTWKIQDDVLMPVPETTKNFVGGVGKFGDAEDVKNLNANKAGIVNTKNLHRGYRMNVSVSNTTLGNTAIKNRTASLFIPVSFGKYYTISGLDASICPTRNILGYSSDVNPYGAVFFVKKIGEWSGTGATFLIDDANIKFIIFQISSDLNDNVNLLQRVEKLLIQVEEGETKSDYVPNVIPQYGDNVLKASQAYSDNSLSSVEKQARASFISNLDIANNYNRDLSLLQLGSAYKRLSSNGIAAVLTGETDKNLSNTLMHYCNFPRLGLVSMYANVMSRDLSTGANYKKQALTQMFNVPSGALDNPETPLDYSSRYTKSNYVHPSIAYDAVGVAGWKYWMINSCYPLRSEGAKWEDEDIFVSNDAVTWLRIKSPYEEAKTYNAPVLSLPPHSFSNDARKYNFLPAPKDSTVLEISHPADNGELEKDRVVVTIQGLPWKHDPCVFIDGGYVYFLTTYLLTYEGDTGGKHKFFVLMRTNNGINWESVRTDGSTFPIATAADSLKLFTKNDEGKYNYLHYFFTDTSANPEVIKWGEGDWELFYGNNFTKKYKGTTPWNFNFVTSYPVKDLSSGNHPGLLKNGSQLILVNSAGIYTSADRGANFTKLAYYPLWQGGLTGITYKKALCIGESGKIVIVDTYRAPKTQTIISSKWTNAHRYHVTLLQTFTSITNFLNSANNGFKDAYVDIQIEQINRINDTIKSHAFLYVAPDDIASSVNYPEQKVLIGTMDIKPGDELYTYVTLTTRGNSEVYFSTVEFS